MLLLKLPSNAAKVKIDPRIGPIHGVHPKAKAAPTRNGNVKLLLYVWVKSLVSLFINLKLIIPISCREKNIMIIPEIILKIFELFNKNFPSKETVDPRAINMKEKPSAKKIVLMSIKLFFFSMSFSRDVPEIYEMYPGIKGSTHGDKKLIRPAKKATDNVVFI